MLPSTEKWALPASHLRWWYCGPGAWACATSEQQFCNIYVVVSGFVPFDAGSPRNRFEKGTIWFSLSRIISSMLSDDVSYSIFIWRRNDCWFLVETCFSFDYYCIQWFRCFSWRANSGWCCGRLLLEVVAHVFDLTASVLSTDHGYFQETYRWIWAGCRSVVGVCVNLVAAGDYFVFCFCIICM